MEDTTLNNGLYFVLGTTIRAATSNQYINYLESSSAPYSVVYRDFSLDFLFCYVCFLCFNLSFFLI